MATADPSPDDLFESPKALLNWAYEDLQRFKELEKAFFESEPYKRVVEFDEKFQRNAHRLRFTRSPPDEMRKLASHIVNDLRHALDQAFVTSARFFGWKPTKRQNLIYFPWAKTRADLQHRLKPIPKEIHGVIYEAEPYFAQSDGSGGDDIIRELGRIAGPNKHEVALRSAALVRIAEMKIDWDADWRVPYNAEGTAEDEVTLGYFPVGSEGNYEADITMFITFREVERLRNHAASDLFDYWGSFANHAVGSLEGRVTKSAI